MQNLIVIFIIGLILYLAIKPLIRFKRQQGNCYSCYGCSQLKNGECRIKGLSKELTDLNLKRDGSVS
jgi:hypothetical protein